MSYVVSGEVVNTGIDQQSLASKMRRVEDWRRIDGKYVRALGQHSVVLQLRLSEGRCVALYDSQHRPGPSSAQSSYGNDDQLRLPAPQGLESRLRSEHHLAAATVLAVCAVFEFSGHTIS